MNINEALFLLAWLILTGTGLSAFERKERRKGGRK